MERYNSENLKKHQEAELTKKVEVSLIHDDAAYFVRAEKYFSQHAKELRRDIDDTFSTYFEERILREKSAIGDIDQDFVKATRGLEDFLRKKFTRQGLDILCRAGKSEDLEKIRTNLQSGYAGISGADAEYLAKHGELTDIRLLVDASTPNFLKSLVLENYEDFHDQVSKAVLGMGRTHSTSMLFSLEIPTHILKRTIELCTDSRFSKISDDALLGLLDHESEDVRKAASIKAVLALSTKRIKSILHEYIGNDEHLYYNVIHWLDLGASMSRSEARKVAGAAASCLGA